MRNTFKVGSRWRVERQDHGGSFTFIIIGPGKNPRYKLCKLEFDNPKVVGHGIQEEYSHEHLKSYAVLEDNKES